MKKWFSVKLQQAPLEPILEGFLASKGAYLGRHINNCILIYRTFMGSN